MDGIYVVKEKPKEVVIHMIHQRNKIEGEMSAVEKYLYYIGLHGEIPRTSVRAENSENDNRAIRELKKLSYYKNAETEEIYRCNVVNESGSGKNSVIRLSATGKKYLDGLMKIYTTFIVKNTSQIFQIMKEISTEVSEWQKFS